MNGNGTPASIHPPLPARIISKIVVRENGCWEWTGSVNKAGYGRVDVGSRRKGAHRFVYEYAVGDIPDGLQLDHLCHTRDLSCSGAGSACPHRRCVNPAHLEPVTVRENYQRGRTPVGRPKERCKHGHVFDEANTYRPPGALHIRICRKCRDRLLKQDHQTVKPLGLDDARHGTLNGYTRYRCRCDRCRKANAERSAELRRMRRGV